MTTRVFCEFCPVTGGPDDCAVCHAFAGGQPFLTELRMVRNIQRARNRRALLRHTPEVRRARLRLIARDGQLIEDGETAR